MDDNQEDSKRPHNYGLNQGYGSLQNVPYTQSQIVGKYADEDDDDDEVEEDNEEEQEQEETNVGDNETNCSSRQNGDHVNNDNQFGDDDDEEDEDDDENGRNDSVNQQRHPKKRKLKSLLSSYEFAPRLPPPLSSMAAPKPSFGGRNILTDWSEHETFVLLDAWGERFLQCGRKSLRSEEWQEVADRVSQESKIERTDSQCRNRLDTLKKKYKKEKASLTGGRNVNTKWVYFKKIDLLLSGENVFLNPSVNLNTANGVDDMRDSGGNGNSDSQEGDDDSDLLPPKKLKPKGGGGGGGGGGSFRLLAESINKFSEIYEKIENGKIQQMIELEKMRMDFHKDLEMQKRKILDRAQAEITKVRQGGDYEENDENVSG